VPIVLKSGSLSFLEPSGPAQACNGIALPLPLLGLFSVGNAVVALSIHSLTSGAEVKDNWTCSADFPVCNMWTGRTLPFLVD